MRLFFGAFMMTTAGYILHIGGASFSQHDHVSEVATDEHASKHSGHCLHASTAGEMQYMSVHYLDKFLHAIQGHNCIFAEKFALPLPPRGIYAH